jgi:hypothetical protein
MTQAFNLSQLANFVNSAGQLNAATGLYNTTTGSSSDVTYLAPYTSAVSRTVNSKLSDIVNVKDFGAVGNGATNDTAAIQAAINTGKRVYIPTGNYYITDALTIATTGQMITGDGRNKSLLKVTSAFNLSANGVIVFTGGEPGAELMSFGINFTQPDTNVRASLTAYPPAIYAVNTPRFTIYDMKITNATNGINMSGNSGGAIIDLLEMSAYNTGIYIDGCLDTVRINKFHFYSFDMTANQTQIFRSLPTNALSVGYVDGLMISEFLNISHTGLYTFPGVSGNPPWIYISNSGFDSFNGIHHTFGRLEVVNSYITLQSGQSVYGIEMEGSSFAQFSNCYLACGDTGKQFVIMKNGSFMNLQFDQCFFDFGVAGALSVIAVADTCTTRSTLQLSNSLFKFYANNTYVINAATPSTGTNNIHFSNNIIDVNPNIAYSFPQFLIQPGNRAYMSGNRITDKGSNAAEFIRINAADYNWISGNISPGWSNVFPSGTGFYSNNLT